MSAHGLGRAQLAWRGRARESTMALADFGALTRTEPLAPIGLAYVWLIRLVAGCQVVFGRRGELDAHQFFLAAEVEARADQRWVGEHFGALGWIVAE